MIRRTIVAAFVVALIAVPSFVLSPGSFHISWNAVAAGLSRHRAVEHPALKGIQANPDSYSVVRGLTLTVSASNGVLANDTNASGKQLTASIGNATAHGTLTLSADGGFRYVNDGSAAASDSFTYTASDGSAVSAPATVTITITLAQPVAAADSFTTSQGQPLTVAAPGVLGNDTLNSAVISSYGASTGTEQKSVGNDTATAQQGTVNIQSNGSFTYNPATNFSGTDTFKYVLTNGAGSSTATVTIGVTVASPVAAGDAYTATKGTVLVVQAPGILANDTLNGATLSSYGATGDEQTTFGASTPTAQGGSVTVGIDGGFTYTGGSSFSGTDSFKYVLRNAGGSSTATVTITVQGSTGVDFVVTSPGFFYAFNGDGVNPPLTLTRGRTYTFQINTSAVHPFEITGAPAGSVSNNNISNGTLTFRVPNNAGNYAYDCSIHLFGNTITVP